MSNIDVVVGLRRLRLQTARLVSHWRGPEYKSTIGREVAGIHMLPLLPNAGMPKKIFDEHCPLTPLLIMKINIVTCQERYHVYLPLQGHQRIPGS
jgi:hypothetical protein